MTAGELHFRASDLFEVDLHVENVPCIVELEKNKFDLLGKIRNFDLNTGLVGLFSRANFDNTVDEPLTAPHGHQVFQRALHLFVMNTLERSGSIVFSHEETQTGKVALIERGFELLDGLQRCVVYRCRGSRLLQEKHRKDDMDENIH